MLAVSAELAVQGRACHVTLAMPLWGLRQLVRDTSVGGVHRGRAQGDGRETESERCALLACGRARRRVQCGTPASPNARTPGLSKNEPGRSRIDCRFLRSSNVEAGGGGRKAPECIERTYRMSVGRHTAVWLLMDFIAPSWRSASGTKFRRKAPSPLCASVATPLEYAVSRRFGLCGVVWLGQARG